MKSSVSRTFAALAFALAAGSAQSAVILSEDFNNAGFDGGSPFLSFSDRLGSTTYSNTASFNGWTFIPQNFLATKTGTSERAILLNENPLGGMTHALTGLVVGQTYNVQFLLSGDNIPGSGYGVQSYIDSALQLTAYGVDGTSASTPGLTVGYSFVATSTSSTLKFVAVHPLSGRSAASPMIDNILVTSTVPEPASLALAGLALAGVGAARRRARG